MNKKKHLTVILPVYNEEAGIYKNAIKISSILDENQVSYEFILVDDGSVDKSWDEIIKLKNSIRITALRFSRNFGKEAALMAALENVKTEGCVILDADLQHPPDVIVEMYRKWNDEGFEIIEGVKKSRGRETIINKIGANFFYKIFKNLSGIDLRKASDFRLLDRKVINVMKELPERETFFRGLSSWVGFRRAKVEFVVNSREEGNTRWSLGGLSRLAITALTSFSSIPLHIVTFMGLIFLLGSLILGIQTLYMKFSGNAVDGFTTVILLQLTIGSTLMISLGITGIYISKIYNEIKHRPRYIVSEKITSE